MDAINFIWNEQKNETNQKKHDIAFEEARTVFYDVKARLIRDDEHSEDEERFIILGFSDKFRLLLVVHCYREEEEVIRIISARKASRNEQRQYEEFLK
jgi:uncharacterized DUF497 family protein